VRIWDAASERTIQVLPGRGSSVTSVAYSPDGKYIVTGSGNNTARIWDVRIVTMSPEDLLVETCKRYLPSASILTRDEMRLLGHPDSQSAIDVCQEFQ
jgi:WD40 repeat protein